MQDFTDFRYVDLKKGKFNTLKVDSKRQSFLPYLVPYSATPCQDVPPISLSKSMKEQLEEQLRGWNARNDKLAMLLPSYVTVMEDFLSLSFRLLY